MPISENDRLDLRQALVEALGSEHLANVAMEAMPPLDYDQLATRADLDLLGRELRAEMAQLRGELRTDLASNLRTVIAAQLTTMMMLGAWVAAVA